MGLYPLMSPCSECGVMSWVSICPSCRNTSMFLDKQQLIADLRTTRLEECTMNGGVHSVKRLSRKLSKRFLRESAEGYTNPTPRPVTETDEELDWLRRQKFGSKQLTKAPRRKS